VTDIGEVADACEGRRVWDLVCGLRPDVPGRARLRMTLEPLNRAWGVDACGEPTCLGFRVWGVQEYLTCKKSSNPLRPP